MSQAFYRKYRSKSLSEIVGQEHITKTLASALKAGKVSHAYLFSGPRGVGKTSVARILAHEVNQLPYDEAITHLDIIEIDAASNRGIEEIRDLREKVHIAPSSAKYKVYIIDEVHMLTKQAFNALLKTLEEPPEHVIFILATTEAHKLPETIISRTQRFTFKPVELSKIVKHLQKITKSEGIEASIDVLELIARHGEGGLRDSISLLDQASSSAKAVQAEDVLRLLGIPPDSAASHLIDLVLTGSPKDLIDQLAGFRTQGYQAGAVAKRVSLVLRQRLLDGQLSLPPSNATDAMQRLLAVPASHDPESLLEITLLGLNLEHASQPVPLPISKATDNTLLAQTTAKTEKQQPQPKTKPTKNKQSSATTGSPQISSLRPDTHDLLTDIWPQVLTTIKERHNTLYSILRMAQPSLDKDSLTLSFAFAFHQKRINEDKTRAIVSEVVTKLMGQPVAVVCLLEKGAKPPQITITAKSTSSSEQSDGSLNAISNIFGGAEVLE